MENNDKLKSLRGKLLITGTIKLETGMHIGASNDFAPIGSVDTPFIRDVVSQEPIIPGSSIKGVIDSAIISHMLRKNKTFRINVQRELKKVLYAYNDFRYKKGYCKKLLRDIFNSVDKIILEHIHVLTKDDGKLFRGILASAFRGVSVSDAMPVEAIKTEVLKKEDTCVDEDGTHEISVHRECILPNQKFSFTLTLDTAMTREIGITSVNQVLDILQEDFDAIHKLLASKFKKVSPSIFKALESANAYIGSNTGFIQKTIIMAAFTDDEKTGIDIIRAILDINFEKAKHATKDLFMAPRAMKLVKWNGHYYEMGGIHIGR